VQPSHSPASEAVPDGSFWLEMTGDAERTRNAVVSADSFIPPRQQCRRDFMPTAHVSRRISAPGFQVVLNQDIPTAAPTGACRTTQLLAEVEATVLDGCWQRAKRHL